MPEVIYCRGVSASIRAVCELEGGMVSKHTSDKQ